jgi:hypothetical protein
MRRRQFIALAGGAAASSAISSFGALAQTASKTYRIGVIGGALTSPPPISY